MKSRLVLASVVAAALAAGSLACGAMPPSGQSPPQSAAAESPIAAIHARKCGQCHTPPEPKTRTRAHLVEAFGRHKHRAKLTPEQWAAMVDYLAAPDGSTAQQGR